MHKNKRDLLKCLAAGSAWSVPMVSSTILPAHAATSCEGGCAQATFGDYANYDPNTGVFTYHGGDSSCSGDGFVQEYAIAQTAEEALSANPDLLCANSSIQAGACTVWFCAG